MAALDQLQVHKDDIVMHLSYILLMNLSLLDTFSAVMKTGSTTRAAALLGISQPAVSRALKRLEDTTKLKLFEREGLRLAPTPEAALLYQEILSAHVGLDRLRQAIVRIREVGTGSLKVASSAALGLTFVPSVIKGFLQRRPNVSLTFEIAGSSGVRDFIASGTFDLGLCADEIDAANLIVQPFIESYGVCVLRPEHPLAKERIIAPGHFHGERLISLAPEDTARKQLDRWLSATGAKPQIVVETQFSATVCQLALEGVGIGVTNVLSYVSGGYEQLGLLARPLSAPIHFRALLALPAQRTRSRLVDEFIAQLSKERDQILQKCRERFPG